MQFLTVSSNSGIISVSLKDGENKFAVNFDKETSSRVSEQLKLEAVAQLNLAKERAKIAAERAQKERELHERLIAEKAEKDRIAEEARLAEEAQLKAEREAQLKAEAEAKLKAEAEAQAKSLEELEAQKRAELGLVEESAGE